MRKTRLLNYKDAGHGLRTKVGVLLLFSTKLQPLWSGMGNVAYFPKAVVFMKTSSAS